MMEMEQAISRVLRFGVLLSAALVIIGITIMAVQDSSITSSSSTRGIGIGDMLSGIASLNGESIVLLGIIALIATPVSRVAMSVIYFSLGRNRLYTVITLIVLANLLIAIFIVPGLLPR